MTYCKVVVLKPAGGVSFLCGRETDTLAKVVDPKTKKLLDAAPVCRLHYQRFVSGHPLMVEYDADNHVLIQAVDYGGEG